MNVFIFYQNKNKFNWMRLNEWRLYIHFPFCYRSVHRMDHQYVILTNLVHTNRFYAIRECLAWKCSLECCEWGCAGWSNLDTIYDLYIPPIDRMFANQLFNMETLWVNMSSTVPLIFHPLYDSVAIGLCQNYCYTERNPI